MRGTVHLHRIMESADRMRENDYIIIKLANFVSRRASLWLQKGKVISKSIQFNLTENLYPLILLKMIYFFVVVT